MNSDFSTNLRMEMARQRLSQTDLARKLNTRQSTVRGWLTGRTPNEATVTALLTALNVDRNALFNRSGRISSGRLKVADSRPASVNGEEIKAKLPSDALAERHLVDYLVAKLASAEFQIEKLTTARNTHGQSGA